VSKAFTRDDDAPAVVVGSARPPLPGGTPNYVTPRGEALLRAELAAAASSAERAGAAAELTARVAGARVVAPHGTPDEVRFGVRVTVRPADDPAAPPRRYTIVGVDEADAPSGRIAFVAPIARALLGRRVGERATVRTGRGEAALEVVAIDHEPLYKIAQAAAWAEAQRSGALPPSAADAGDGFVHLSAADQVRATASRHFAGARDLVLLAVDPARLDARALRWEPSRDGQPFPHLYGPLRPAHVVAAHALPLGPDGAHQFPEET
jgi:transcription elongation factor GreB